MDAEGYRWVKPETADPGCCHAQKAVQKRTPGLNSPA